MFFGQQRGWLREAFSLLQQVSPPVARDLEGWVEALEQQSDRFDSERGIRTLIRSSVSVQYFVFAGVEVEAAHLLDAHSRREYLLVTPKGGLALSVPGVSFSAGISVIEIKLADLKGVTVNAGASFDLDFIDFGVSYDGSSISTTFGGSKDILGPARFRESSNILKLTRRDTRVAQFSTTAGYAFLFEVDYLPTNLETKFIRAMGFDE